MPIGITMRLHNAAGSALTNQSGITALWWDVDSVEDFTAPTGKTVSASTDSSGDMILDLSNVSGLSVGDYGFLVLYDEDLSDHKDSPTFVGKVQTSTVSGGTVLGYTTTWVRNTFWQALSSTTANNTFSGLYAVYPLSPNWCTLKFTVSAGQYTVDWGDSTSNQNVDSATTVYKSFAYADCPDNDVGKANEVACTFTDAGDLIEITAHSFKNGQLVSFSEVTTTTGVSVGALYYVVNAAANSLQVSDTVGGTARALTTNGTGKIYVTIYRTAVVDVVPTTGGSDFTAIDLGVRHTSASAVAYTTNWIDIAVKADALATIVINGANTDTSILEQFSGDIGSVVNFSSMFSNCYALQTIPLLNTAAGTNFSYMFSNCYALQSIPLLNTAAGTNFSYMFYGCASLQSIPLLNTAAGTDFYSMFSYCYSLHSVPLLNTAAGTYFSSMFGTCSSLHSVPLLNTAAGTNFSYMFSGCTSLKSIPLLNTAAGTNFSYMFSNCYALQSIPLLNTAAVTSFYNMFSGCTSLQSIPLLNTAAGTDFSYMFNGCSSLTSARLAGTAYSIDYSNAQLSGGALNEIYRGLATVTSKTITVTGNYGTAADDPTIATAKGWTVTS